MLFAELILSTAYTQPIMSNFWHLCSEYGRFYQEGTITFWRSLRPSSYSAVLAGVWLIGFLLLKSGGRK